MTECRAEGGPIDGRTITTDANVLQVPVPRRDPLNVRRMRDPGRSFDVTEYRRRGRVFRWEGLIDDARSEMQITAEVFREEAPRRFAREILRKGLEDLAAEKDQEVDRIVWVVALERRRMMFTLAAFVGPRRAEMAAHRRAELRSGLPSG